MSCSHHHTIIIIVVILIMITSVIILDIVISIVIFIIILTVIIIIIHFIIDPIYGAETLKSACGPKDLGEKLTNCPNQTNSLNSDQYQTFTFIQALSHLEKRNAQMV